MAPPGVPGPPGDIPHSAPTLKRAGRKVLAFGSGAGAQDCDRFKLLAGFLVGLAGGRLAFGGDSASPLCGAMDGVVGAIPTADRISRDADCLRF